MEISFKSRPPIRYHLKYMKKNSFRSSKTYYNATETSFTRYSNGYDCMHCPIFFGGEKTRSQGLKNLDDLVIDSAQSFLKDDSSYLDIGCGRGMLLLRVSSKANISAYGIVSTTKEKEICHKKLHSIGKKQLPLIYLSDMNNITSINEFYNNFDLVTTIESQSYFTSEERLFDAITYSLKRGGSWISVNFTKHNNCPNIINRVEEAWAVNSFPKKGEFFSTLEKYFCIEEHIDLSRFLKKYWKWELGNFKNRKTLLLKEAYNNIESEIINPIYKQVNFYNAWAFAETMELVRTNKLSYHLTKVIKK